GLRAMPDLRVCVIFNPVAARGRARHRLEEVRNALGSGVEFQPTQHAGHAEELAFRAAGGGFATVAAAGGDGTVHEVADGLLRANNPGVLCAVCPLGSANDYAYSLGVQAGNSPPPPGADGVLTVDVGVVRGEDGRERFFVNTLGLGFSGAVTIEARQIRR